MSWEAPRKSWGTVKKIFRCFAPEFVPPTFEMLPAPLLAKPSLKRSGSMLDLKERTEEE